MIKQYNKDNSIADFNFILQYKSIPFETRKRYYFELKWKGGNKYSNRIKFIEILERYLAAKIKPLWNNDSIIKKLGLSRASFFCLKSRLLKSLREYYFQKSYEHTNNAKKLLEQARKKISQGMIREAKVTLYKCERLIQRKPSIFAQDVLVLSEIYEYLLIYYHRQRNKTAFNLTAKKLKNLRNNKIKLTKEQNTIFSIRENIANAFSEIFLVRSEKSNEVALKNYLTAANLAKKIGKDKYYLKMLFYAGNIQHETGKTNYALNTFQKGYNFACLKKMKSEKNIFHTKLMLLNFLKDNSKAKEFMQLSEIYYNEAIKNPYDVDYTMHILFHYLRFTSFCGYGEKFKSLGEELVNRLFLYSRKADAVFRWYALEADKYIEKLYRWYEENGDVKAVVDENVLDLFENFNYGVLLQFGKFYSYDQLSFVYTTQIELEFWKGKKCNFENAYYYTDKMKRIAKKISSYSNTGMVDTLKLCLKILEESLFKKPEEVYVKYLPDLKTRINNLESKEKTYNLSNEFSFLSFTSEILGVSEFKTLIKSFEKWIRLNQPGIFEELLNLKKAV